MDLLQLEKKFLVRIYWENLFFFFLKNNFVGGKHKGGKIAAFCKTSVCII